MRVQGKRVLVDYEVPDYYCQNTGDWPPFFTCANDPLASSDHLFLFDNGSLVRTAFIYYEKGTWDTGLVLQGCGDHNLTAQVTFVAEQPLSIRAATGNKTETVVDLCKSRLICGAPTGGGQGGGFGPGITVSKPINVGSGDVSLSLPLFTLAQTPLSLAFTLSYHSESPVYPDLVSAPVGSGWTDSFAQTLRPVDASRAILYHLTPEGFESEYTLQSDGSWTASSPGDLRGRVTQVGSQYQLTDLNGMVTAFDTATGHWVSTTDRWGNAITSTYTGANLTTIADSMGRQVSLVYTGSQVTQIILPDGQTWRLAYAGGNLTDIFDPLHTGPSSPPWRSFAYQADRAGITRLLSEVRDDAGALLEAHTYDSLDRGTSTVSEDGRDQVIIEYATPGQGQTRVTSTIDGVTNQVAVFSLIYQQGRFLPTRIDGNCATCSGASSDTQSFTYTADNLVTSRTDGKGHTATLQYNPDANVTSKTEATGTGLARTTTYRYDYSPWPNFLTEVDEPSAAKPGAQKITTMTWNTTGTPETVLTTTERGFLQPGDPAATSYVRTATFDGRHRLFSTDGPRSDVADVTTQAYYGDTDGVLDRRGRISQVTDPVGLVTNFDNYDVFGTARNVTDSNGILNTITPDARGRVVTSTSKAVTGDPNEATDYVTSFTYDGRDRLTKTTSPRGNAMAYTYEDGTNRLLDTIRLDTTAKQQERRHLSLDTIGQVVQQQDQSCGTPSTTCASWTTKRQESFGFDGHNRLAEVVHPSPPGGVVINAYDPDGLLSSVQDENHQLPNTRYAYDALDRLVSVTQTLAGAPGGQIVTSYAYDVMDNLTAATDPNGNTTTYAYDDFRRMQSQNSPVTGTTTYVYDPAGNLVSSTDANGAATTRTYDSASRLLRATSARTGLPTETATYTYDSTTAGNYGKGRLASMTDPSGSTTYAYERRGLLRTEARTIEGNTYTSAYAYDANGNRSRITYPSGRSVNYTFDFADRPLSATSGSITYVAAATYLPFGPETSITFGNGTTKTATFDMRYRPTENKLTKTGATVADYTYTEDLLGNITRIQDATDQTYNRDFTYDDLNRLTGASTGASLWGTGAYAYDKMGNMTSLSVGSSRAATFNYTNTLPKLASVTENGIPRSVAYDNAGNEASVGASTSTYSARNFLAAADGLTYAYDARGLRTITAASNQFGTITGTVVNSSGGSPIPNATVRVTGTASSTATDASGNFTLVQIAGTYTLTVTKPGFLPVTTDPFTLGAGGTVAVGTIQLSVAPGTISGTVITSAGLGPLPGATATVTGTTNATTTDAAGDFVLSQAPGTYTVTITKTGFTAQTTSSFALAAGGAQSVGTITLQAIPATVTGRVINAIGGAPLAGATVTANSTQAVSVQTDPSGNFSLNIVTGTHTLTITKTGFATTTTAPFTVAPGGSFDTGTIAIDPLGTITGTVIQAIGGSPLFGATVVVTGTFNFTTTSVNGSFTLTQPAGTYTLEVSAPGYATTTTSAFSLTAGGTATLENIQLFLVAMSVYVAYADDLRSSPVFPIPWKGAPNTVFIGTGSPFDAGAIRLDNSTDSPINVDSVSVNLRRPGPIFNLWSDFTIPAHGSVILTQTRYFNFDTSDYPIAPCNQPVSSTDPRVPKVTITVDGIATDYFDTAHILDTGGFDKACSGNESHAWQLIGTTAISANGDFLLGPETASVQTGTPYTAIASFSDTAGQPVAGVTVNFQVVSGANAGQSGTSGTAVTDSLGHASFTYTASIVGTDFLKATITNASGGTLTSNQIIINWTGPPGLEVFVGYADDLRSNPNFPIPWSPSTSTLNFVGSRGSYYDAGAIRLDNLSPTPITIETLKVDLQRPGPVYNLPIWSNFVVPALGSAIVTQNGAETFDSSDHAIVSCGGTVSPTDPRIPKITLTIAGVQTNFLDTAHILDTFGYDLACRSNESLQWRPIGTSALVSGQLALFPASASNPVSGSYTATAVLTDAGGEPQSNVTVHFTVLTGPKAGTTGQAVTNSAGMASFTYTSATAGTDTLRASVDNASGGTLLSGTVTAVWVPTIVLTLSPATASKTIGTSYNATVLATDGANNPVANVNVGFAVVTGSSAGVAGQTTTGANGQAVFTYTNTFPGTDALQASVTLQGGNVLLSNQATVDWTTTLNIALSPATGTSTLQTNYTATAFVTTGGQAVPGIPVNFQVLTGPNVNRLITTTTNTAGQTTFTYTSAITGLDTIQASATQNGLVATSNQVTVNWISGATTVTYTGPASGEYNDPLTMTARLSERVSGALLPGRVLTFTLGAQTATGTTDATGVATVTITPLGTPGPTTLMVSFAGDPTHTSSSTTTTVTIAADETALAYTGATSLGANPSDCAALGGSIVGAECRISTAVTKGGTFTINQTLHLLSGGTITVAAPGLAVSIAGDLVMDAGSMIDGNVNGCNTGRPITLLVTGNVTLSASAGSTAAATIRSDSCSGGDIVLYSKSAIEIDGLVESVGSITGTGAVQPPGGGPITIDAAGNLTVGDAGKVSSRGVDPGADLVHLGAAGQVTILGIVESTGNTAPKACSTFSSIASNFQASVINAGNFIWFNNVMHPTGLGTSPTSFFLDHQTITFTANSTVYTLSVPDATIILNAPVCSTCATTTFDTSANRWITHVPPGVPGGPRTFLSGLVFQVPSGGLPGAISPVTWKGAFSTDTPGVQVSWQWGAAVYTSFSTDYNALGVKPVDDQNASKYKNVDQAGTPENYKGFLIAGARGGGASNYTGGWSGTASIFPCPASTPNKPPNHCDSVNRPGKPAGSTACVEICAGDTLTIDTTQAHNGQVNADLTLGGATGRSWIDLSASGNLTIKGDTVAPYAVHANNSPTDTRAGDITAKSVNGNVTTLGLAVQANATVGGGKGGTITVQAGAAGTPQGDVGFGTASIQAKGATSGGAPAGGQIIARSFSGHVIGAAGGELNAAGGITPNGSVSLQGCATVPPAVTYQGTVTPAPATILAASCGGSPVVPSCTVTGIPVGNQVSARLTDPADQVPISNKVITFSLGTASASATTNTNGVASTSLPLASTQGTGAATVQASFAGDTFEQASQTTAAVTVYQPTSFVIWGGNTPGLAIGQRVNFWGSTWNTQVTGGNYTAGSDFLGFATPVHDEGICEPSARTTGATLLDFGCWTAKPGTASPPATLPTYISAIVATSVGEVSGRVYGNIAAVVVLQVDTTPAYGPGTNQQGFGTIRAVIEDGANLFPQNATTAPLSELREPGTSRVSLAGTIASLHFGGLGFPPRSNQPGSPRHSLWLAPADAHEEAFGDLGMTGTERGRGSRSSRSSRVSAMALDPGSRRYSFYSPEMNLLAESELTTGTTPAILYEYIWFNGHPVAQLDGGTLAHWTFTDHLGTPLLQTDSTGTVFWRAEHEPFGNIFALRTADQHQTLRLPGQEVEQLNLGNNGITDRSYNIFRWYRSTWGRYTQPDPLGIRGSGDANLYRYVSDNPLSFIDPDGRAKAQVCCRTLRGELRLVMPLNSFDHHCFIRLITDNGVAITYGLYPDPGTRLRGTACPQINDPSDQNATGLQCADTDCADPGCISSGTRSYPCHGLYDAAHGPNSNTFASYVSSKCNLNTPLFANPTTAPGWGASPPRAPR